MAGMDIQLKWGSSTIAYVVNLRDHHHVPLPRAYTRATAEFVKLRGAHEMATLAAQIEAQHHGAVFGAYKSPFVSLSKHLFCGNRSFKLMMRE